MIISKDKILFRAVLIALLLNTNNFKVFSQKYSTTSPEKINVFKNSLFIGENNLVVIYIPNDTANKLILKISEGEVFPFAISSGMYYVSVHKIGKATLKVCKEINGVNKLLCSKIVQTKVLPLTKEQKELNKLTVKPILAIKGYVSGKIPRSIIKSASQFDINSPYKLISTTVYFSNSIGTACVTTVELKGNVFDDNFLKYWSQINETSLITLDNVKIVDQKGKTFSLSTGGFVVAPD